MRLSQYPQAISEAAKALNELEDVLSDRRETMRIAEAQVDHAVANDSNLKNDSQRKAQRAMALLEDAHYQACVSKESELTRKIADAKADLERLRNEFSVAKLEVRLAIADKLAGIDARDLIGV